MISKGMPAPEFCLFGADMKTHSLSEFRGKKVVLYFYSKDNTAGCTAQALGYQRLAKEFSEAGAVLIGISKDSPASHARFAEKQGLSFLLLSDPEFAAIGAYDVWKEKKNYGKTIMGVLRSSFIIDEQGTVLSARYGVKAANDPDETLALLKSL